MDSELEQRKIRLSNEDRLDYLRISLSCLYGIILLYSRYPSGPIDMIIAVVLVKIQYCATIEPSVGMIFDENIVQY